MQPTSHKPKDTPALTSSSSPSIKEEDKLKLITLDKINDAGARESPSSLLGRKFTWLKSQIGDFFSWIGSLFSRITLRDAQEIPHRSNLALIDNPFKEGDKIEHSQLNDIATPNDNKNLSFKVGDLIAYPFSFEYKVYRVDSIKNGEIIVRLDQWNTSTCYNQDKIWKLKRKIEEEEPSSRAFKAGDVIKENEIAQFASKKSTDLSVYDLVAVHNPNGYKVYFIQEVRKNGQYGIHGDYLADSYLVERKDIIRLKSNPPNKEG